MVKTKEFDAADYLDSPETIAAYLNEAFVTNDVAFISLAIGDVARAKGMSAVAAETGLARESLYKSLNGTTKPEFDTVRRILESFNVRLVAEAKTDMPLP